MTGSFLAAKRDRAGRRHNTGAAGTARGAGAAAIISRGSSMKPVGTFALAGLMLALAGTPARPACCYFSAKDKDILQPAQKVFITWNPDEKVESFTAQPKFEGNADDFGMVIPTPAKPKLDEMPRDFFKELAVYSILKKREM